MEERLSETGVVQSLIQGKISAVPGGSSDPSTASLRSELNTLSFNSTVLNDETEVLSQYMALLSRMQEDMSPATLTHEFVKWDKENRLVLDNLVSVKARRLLRHAAFMHLWTASEQGQAMHALTQHMDIVVDLSLLQEHGIDHPSQEQMGFTLRCDVAAGSSAMPVIMAVLDHTPACDAGLVDGDVLCLVGGRDVCGGSSEEICSLMMRSLVNGKVTVTVQRMTNPGLTKRLIFALIEFFSPFVCILVSKNKFASSNCFASLMDM